MKITLAAGVLAGLAAAGITLARSPLTIARVNTSDHSYLTQTREPVAACQSDETLPRGTSAIRLRDFSFLGPRVTVEVLAHGRVITRGEHESGWTGGAVTIPVKPLATARSGVRLCFGLFNEGDEYDGLVGEPTSGAAAATQGGASIPGRVRVEYLRASQSSWFSDARAVARRMGLGRAWPGAWNALLVLVLMGGVVLLCAGAMLRESG